ncbi:hypothetical protein BA895_21900 [Humibacillus sp. DSM 29435]|uniref:TetR/AcrR family transcriptional regulator n=1 Tax=Humibacillus sp. DSM 29435 TaxID=1869167 RepID=UPI000872018E|nr:TetR/AcrR family transcriptional regulator [Humibacillus sp. DSM 29435]OFE15691.1 hypothetical protein BA895_21900 [Humibacillus sp. DSM 29435]
MAKHESTTRARLLTEALRLFGENGFKATSVAEIEKASGLAPGGGGLYRHFASKRDLLIAAVEHEAERNQALLQRLAYIAANDGPAATPKDIAWAGLERLRQERNLNRLIVRGLDDAPDLLELAATNDIRPVHDALESWLRGQACTGWDTAALAAVLAGAITHFWLLEDLFGEHPTGVTAEAYITTLAGLCSTAFAHAPPPDPPTSATPADRPRRRGYLNAEQRTVA